MDFGLAGADIVPLVVLSDFGRVRPQAAEAEGGCAREGQLPVDQKLPLDIHAPALRGQVLQPDIVQAGLRHRHGPGDFGLIRHEKAFVPDFPAALECQNVHGNFLFYGRLVRESRLIGVVRVTPSDARDVRGQIHAGVFVAEARGALIQQPYSGDQRRRCQNPDENVSPFP